MYAGTNLKFNFFQILFIVLHTYFTYLWSFNCALYANKDGYRVKRISITFRKSHVIRV